MNQADFNTLQNLLAKLDLVAHQAATKDRTFKKYNTGSIEILKELPIHLRQLEQALKNAKVVSTSMVNN